MLPTHLPKFFVRQKITLMVNRYEIIAPNEAGGEGEVVAFAQQKRMPFKEKVIFYRDESKSVARSPSRRDRDSMSGPNKTCSTRTVRPSGISRRSSAPAWSGPPGD